MMSRHLSLTEAPVIRQMGLSTHGQQRVQRWSNLTFWSLHAYHYRAVLIAGGEVVEIEPGTVTVLPPGVDLEYHFTGPSRHVYAHLLPATRGERRAVGLVHRLGDSFERFEREFREAVGWFSHEPPRARARVWDLLWRLADPSGGVADPKTTMPAALSRTLERIELTLAIGLSVSDLAEAVDLSQAHLARLFRQHLSVSPLQYILRRRIERAEHLLRHTTLPIKVIACEIGLRDLQQFNKLLRRRTGKAPRRLRNG